MTNTNYRCCVPLIVFLFLAAGVAAPEEREQREPLRDRPTVGLVLSGGGARGAAHIGVIKVLDELRIPIDYIAGTSMGAIVGGLYASGVSADELQEIFETSDWNELLSDRPARSQRSFRRKTDDIGFLVNFDIGIDKSGLIFPEGFVQGQNLELALKNLSLSAITVDDFDELPIPFRAVATDIVSGKAAVLDSGDLATAMRASMSAPGLFKPVRLGGQILVDGGVANNLPVQVVRDMGADILVVVDVGFPLLREDELGSALAVTKQMLTILINSRAQDQIARMASGDILIAPDLADIASQDFQRMPEAQQLGAEEANEHRDDLRTLSIPEDAYIAYRERLTERRGGTPFIGSVVVDNESRLSPKVIEARLADQHGKPLDVSQLEADISRIYGLQTFETVTYDVLSEPQGNTLYLKATEKRWGPNYVRFGINLEDNFDGDSSFNVAARLTRTEMNELGGEFRTEFQVGQTPRLFAEFYQPLDYGSRWFVNPSIELIRTSSDLFVDGVRIAQFRSSLAEASIQGGRQFGNWGEFRVGLSRGHSDATLRIGSPGFEIAPLDLTTVSARFAYDTIDRISIPTAGANISIGWSGSRESLGSDETFDIAALFFLKAHSWGKNTLLHWWDFGSTVKNDSIGIQPFSLGGLFNLSGYAPDELSGSHSGTGRLLYYRRLGNDVLPVFNTAVYLGSSIELGGIWQSTDAISFDNTLFAGSVFLAFDTVLGPLYIAYGAAEGGRQSAYLFLGQTF